MSLPATFVKGFHDEEAVKKMEYLPFGKTGLNVSKIAIGGATCCHLFGELDEEEAIATIREAIRKGINYVDTAPYYGQGKSEEVVGKALKGIPREAYYLATKVGRYEKSGPKQFDYSAARTRESIEKSLKLLGVDYVDVLQIHDIEFAPNLDVVVNECLPAVEALKKEGKTRNIGVSAYPLNVLKECISRAPGRFDTVLGYARYTLIDDTFLEYIQFFKDNNLAIICASGHALGLLGNLGGQPWHPANPHTIAICEEARQICIKEDVQLGKLAMHYVMQLEGAAPFLVGMQTRKLLEINLSAISEGLTDKEAKLLTELQQNVYSKIQHKHWEGVELERYWADMAQYGLVKG